MSWKSKLRTWATGAMLLVAAAGFVLQPALAGSSSKGDDAEIVSTKTQAPAADEPAHTSVKVAKKRVAMKGLSARSRATRRG